jgi:hypothetical protein
MYLLAELVLNETQIVGKMLSHTIVGVLLFIYLLKISDTVPTFFSDLLKNVLQAPPIEPLDSQLSLDDLDVIKVIGKGNSGNVQLVRHKFTGQFFALKVFQTHSFFHAAYLWFFTVKSFRLISVVYLLCVLFLTIVKDLRLHRSATVFAGYSTKY